LRIIAVAILSTLPIAGCNARSGALPGGDLPVTSGIEPATTGSDDDWTTFAYDYHRTGYNPKVSLLSRLTVSKLKLRWKESVGNEIFANPVVYAGNVIVVTRGVPAIHGGATVYDFRASDGHLLWKFAIGAESKMSPTIDPAAGLVIVGNEQKYAHRKPSYVYALRLLDGSVVWRQAIHGLLHAAPVVTGGRIYLGRAGGDPPLCLQGGITALNESTGKILWSWSVDSKPNEGGSVWGAIAYDGSHLVFGTGNTCQQPIPTANGAVALNLDGKPAWSTVAVKDSYYDSDTGGGVMLYGGRAHFINKNGRFYALNQATGSIEWTADLNPEAGPPTWLGGFATPTTDGKTIVEDSGLYANGKSDVAGEYCVLTVVKPNEVFPGEHSRLYGMNMSGHVLWSRTMQNRLPGYVAITQGLGFAGLNQSFVGFDLSTGQTRWAYETPFYIDASMVVVPSGVYGADDGGNVYAFALPSSR
jgi:outer membrane protein assembly factor BamB